MSDLEEVDIEKQLKAAEESGEDTGSIVLSEPEDDEEVEDSGGVENLADQVVDNLVEEDEMGKESDIDDENDDDDDVENKPSVVLETNEIPSSTFVDENVDLDEISSEEDSDDDEYDENMRKLEQEINQDFLYSYHPETKQINYKELLTLSNVTRNKKGVIIDPLHQTIPILTRYEKAKILGLRAKQINHGAKPFVELTKDIIDGHTIAYMELKQNKIPFIIRRPMPNGGSEYWKVSDLKNID
tara:strand:- start:1097 stop:1825 length:729 start_codon:yes stop_codon:yes gene_type:complete